jgi:hypothetical protein
MPTSIQDLGQKMYEKADKIRKENMGYIVVGMILLIIAIVIYGISRIKYILGSDQGLLKNQCKKLSIVYSTKNRFIHSYVNQLSIAGTTDELKPFPLCAYYIKTAYNCCSVGKYVDDYVDTCALSTVISQGVRCFDFEIFNIDGQAIISTSTSDSFFIKQTYTGKENLKFKTALALIVKEALNDPNKCPNTADPVFINLRFKTNSVAVLNNLVDTFTQYINRYLLPIEYQYGKKDINYIPINELEKKIVIMAAKSSVLDDPGAQRFMEFVNMISGPSYKIFSSGDLEAKNISDTQKESMVTLIMATPNQKESNPDNPNSVVLLKLGIQFIAMRYQLVDDYLEYYEAYFNNKGSAIVLKDKELRPVILSRVVEEVGKNIVPRTTAIFK